MSNRIFDQRLKDHLRHQHPACLRSNPPFGPEPISETHFLEVKVIADEFEFVLKRSEIGIRAVKRCAQ